MNRQVPFFIFFIGFTFVIQESWEQVSEQINDNDLILSNTNFIIIFGTSIAVVIGIFIYLARHLILRRKNEYEQGEFESKKNRDYEKYHSEWNSEDFEFGKTGKNESDEFTKSMHGSPLPNYYQILGVQTDATQNEIKNQFRRLAKEWHPDKQKGTKSTEEKMANINKAYEILSNKDRRKSYDKFFNAT